MDTVWIVIKMIKHQCRCNDCKKYFFLEDALWCIHKRTIGIGSKACPHCGTCICHGETTEEIQNRFNRNIRIGKFVKVKKPIPTTNWSYQCKTIKEINVK